MTSSFLEVFEVNETCKFKLKEEDKSYTFPFPLDDFQEAGCAAIEKQENVLITAHTGSGKTVLALYGIGWAIKNNKKAIYTSPIKSLSNQKYYEFVQNFGMDSTIGIMTGDIKINSDAQIMVMTTEILRNLLYKDKQLDGLKSTSLINFDDVGVIIMDEVHYINDPDRGKVWEEVLMMSRPETTLIMLSATLDRPEQFGSWIGEIKQKPIHLIKTSHRVVPLKHYFLKDYEYEDEETGKKRLRWDYVEICNNHHVFRNYDQIKHKFKRYDVSKTTNLLVEKLKEDGYLPALFFVFSRKKCEQLSHSVKISLLEHEELNELTQIFEQTMLKYKSTYEHLEQYNDVYKQIQKGVAYHHSGMIPILKEIVEILFSKGLIKVLFATETFAIGVNMPTKTVIFNDLQKFDNNGRRFLRSDEYNQMAGRAGRRGLDSFGNVILMPTFDLPSENMMKQLMSGKSPHLNSKFQLNYQFILKTIINSEFDINDYLENTFFKQEKNKFKVGDLNRKKELDKKLENYYNIDDKMKIIFDRIQEIENRFKNTYIKIKNKERSKLNNELRSLKDIKNYPIHETKYKEYLNIKKDLDDICQSLWNIDYGMLQNMDNMKQLLNKNEFLDISGNPTQKGLISSCISDVNELVLGEAINNGLFDNLNFEDIIGLLSSFINEKDPNSEEKYLGELDISPQLNYALKQLNDINEKYMDQESMFDINIKTDFQLYLDFIEPSVLWSSGKTLKEVYEKIQIYEGNFVRAILRISNILMNIKDLFEFLGKHETLKKIENFEEKLLRNEVSVNSIYVNGL
jgi:superfamily II RNA helicase